MLTFLSRQRSFGFKGKRLQQDDIFPILVEDKSTIEIVAILVFIVVFNMALILWKAMFPTTFPLVCVAIYVCSDRKFYGAFFPISSKRSKQDRYYAN